MIYDNYFFHEHQQKHNVCELHNTLKIAKIMGSRIGLNMQVNDVRNVDVNNEMQDHGMSSSSEVI